MGLDVNPEIETLLDKAGLVGLTGDVTSDADVRAALDAAVRRFGGLDVVVSNAGIFPPGQPIEQLEEGIWRQCLDVNLLSQRPLLRHSIPYLKRVLLCRCAARVRALRRDAGEGG